MGRPKGSRPDAARREARHYVPLRLPRLKIKNRHVTIILRHRHMRSLRRKRKESKLIPLRTGPINDPLRLPGGRAPEPGGASGLTRRQPTAVRREGDTINWPRMRAKDPQLAAAR